MSASIGPLVSIIVPVYNGAPFLGETLRAVLAQTYRNFEIVVVDDGSHDGSADIAEAIAREDARVRVLRRANAGVSAARNAGLNAARGEKVMFLDCDDWVTQDYLERMLAALACHPGSDIPYCAYIRVPPDGAPLPPQFDPEVQKKPFETLARYCAFAIHCVLLPRRLVLDVGGFDPTLKTREDWDLWIRLARAGASFVAVAEPLAFYRMRPGSASFDAARMMQDMFVILARVQAPDARVPNPDPRYAGGLPVTDAPVQLMASAMFLAANEIPFGRLNLSALKTLDPLPDTRDMRVTLREALISGLTMMRSADALTLAWSEIEPLIHALCAELDNPARPDLAHEMVSQIAVRLLDQCALDTPRTVGRLHARRIALLEPLPALALDQGVDCLYARLMAGGRLFESTSFPVSRHIAPDRLAAMILEHWGFSGLLRRRGLRRWIRLPFAYARKTYRDAREILRSKRQRKARLLSLMRGALPNFMVLAGFVYKNAPYKPQGLKDPRRALALVENMRAEIDAALSLKTERKSGGRVISFPARPRTARKIPILMYHRIAHDGPQALAPYRLPPERFEEQLGFLRAQGYSAVTSGDLIAALRQGRPLPARPIMLTFDDAYRDFYSHGAPLLAKYGFTAEVFVVTGKVGGQSDWDADYGPTAPLMDWEEILALSARGFAFGSHLVSHRRATDLPDEELVREGALSRFTLEARLRKDVLSLALPFGDHDKRVIQAMALCGYKIALTCEDDVASLEMNPLRFPRIEVFGTWDLKAFAARLGHEAAVKTGAA